MATTGLDRNGLRNAGRGERRSVARRVAVGGMLGALPGLLIALVPLLLHGLGVISADQSQIGFVGVPLLIVGTPIGIAIAASGTSASGAVWLGAGLGLVVGLGVGLVLTIGLAAAGVGLPGIWLLTAAAGMLIGAAWRAGC